MKVIQELRYKVIRKNRNCFLLLLATSPPGPPQKNRGASPNVYILLIGLLLFHIVLNPFVLFKNILLPTAVLLFTFVIKLEIFFH